MAYAMSGTNEEDDVGALVQGYTNFALGTGDGLTVKLNNETLYTSILGNIGAVQHLLYLLPTPATKLKYEFNITNPNSKALKIGRGITGGTYNAPTGANGHGGSVSTGSTIDANGSKLDLQLG